MSSNPQSQTQQSPSPVQKDKKQKKQTNRKKRATINQQQQNTLMKQPLEKQLLLTKFCKKNNNSSNQTNSTNSQQYLPNHIAKQLLQDQLKKKDQIIQKLQQQNKNQQHKSTKQRQQFLQYSQTTKQSILDSKKQLAVLKRRQKGEVISKYGHFRDQLGNNFIQGQYLSELKNKMVKVQNSINELQAQKSSITLQCKHILTSRIDFNKKQLFQLKQQLQSRQKQVNFYKQQLKIYYKEQECIFAKDSWPLLKHRYQPLYFINSGGFGEVYKGYDIQKYQDVAIKIHSLDKQPSQSFQLFLKHLTRQIKIHKQLQHPNIVRMIDQLQFEENRIGLVMQYCTGPQLRAYLKKQGGLDERQAKFIIKQLIYAIKYLHDQKYSVIHYDLKPANILFHNGIVKIVDFGISKIIQSEDSQIDLTSDKAGTYHYLPPEVFIENNPKISSKVDVWSIGVIFFQLLYNRKPFGNGFSQLKILQTGEILKATHVDFPSCSPKNYKISEQAKVFIRSCLQYFPDKRLSPLEAYQHDYIN